MTITKTTATALGGEFGGLQLQRLGQRFKAWRATRALGQRIPEELWQAAAGLARIHGLNRTVAALKLNYYDLERRLQAGRAPRRGRAQVPVFVEVPAMPLPAGGEERGTVELVQAGGARLILRFSAAGPRDLLPVVQLFLQHRS